MQLRLKGQAVAAARACQVLTELMPCSRSPRARLAISCPGLCYYPIRQTPFRQVRRWLFFHLATLGLIEAVDGLAASAAAVLAAPARTGRGCCRPAAAEAALLRRRQAKAAAGAAGGGQQEVSGKAVVGSVNGEGAPAAPDIESAPAQATAATAANGAAAAAGSTDTEPRAKAGDAGAPRRPWVERVAGRLRRGVRAHTAWLAPWLPLALNMEQFKHLRATFTRDVPAMFSSRQGAQWRADAPATTRHTAPARAFYK